MKYNVFQTTLYTHLPTENPIPYDFGSFHTNYIIFQKHWLVFEIGFLK